MAVLQEGIASEAAAFGGHQKLDNLILIYDSNDVTLDAMAKMSQSEDTAERFRAYGYDVHTVNGNDMEAFLATFEAAKDATTGKPQFIVSRTLIGKGIPEVAGTQKAHGEAGVKYVDADRKALGLPDAEVLCLQGGLRIFCRAQAIAQEAISRLAGNLQRVEKSESRAGDIYWSTEFITRYHKTWRRGSRPSRKIAKSRPARREVTFCSPWRRHCRS